MWGRTSGLARRPLIHDGHFLGETLARKWALGQYNAMADVFGLAGYGSSGDDEEKQPIAIAEDSDDDSDAESTSR